VCIGSSSNGARKNPCQASFFFTAAPTYSSRKNVRLMKLPLDNSLYWKVAERQEYSSTFYIRIALSRYTTIAIYSYFLHPYRFISFSSYFRMLPPLLRFFPIPLCLISLLPILLYSFLRVSYLSSLYLYLLISLLPYLLILLYLYSLFCYPSAALQSLSPIFLSSYLPYSSVS
jgi:hypothetical protein